MEKVKILVVEDEIIIADSICNALNDLGYHALEPAINYTEAIETIESERPDIAILCNITPDHLDRYDYQFENYIASKFRITQNQKPNDYLIYCQDDTVITNYLQTNTTEAQCLPFSYGSVVDKGAYVINKEFHL